MTTLSKDVLDSGDPRLPLHRRLADALEAKIRAGEFTPSQALPSESDIARDCGVALGTVRQAMTHLRESGMIERRQGRGTYVRRADFSSSLLRFFRFGEGGAVVPEGKVLSLETVSADVETAKRLDVQVGDDVIMMERLRSLAGTPLVHEQMWVPLPEFESLKNVGIHNFPQLLYPYYEERLGVVIGHAAEELTFAEATRRDSELLGCPENSPMISIERVATAVSGKPVERRVSRGDARTFRYRVEIS